MFEILAKLDTIIENIDTIIGFLIAIISFILVIIWDNYKYKRDQEKKDEAVLFAVKQEQNKNLDILKGNIKLLDNEIQLLDKRKIIPDILQPLYSKSWEFLILNFPDKLNDKEITTRIMDAIYITSRINIMINIRDNHKISNFQMFHDAVIKGSYLTILNDYDEMLSKDCKQLLKILEDLPILK